MIVAIVIACLIGILFLIYIIKKIYAPRCPKCGKKLIDTYTINENEILFDKWKCTKCDK